MEEYQGWTNWDTWNANLWLTNDEWSYQHALEAPSANDLESVWIDFFEGKDGITTSKVNFEEIYESLKE